MNNKYKHKLLTVSIFLSILAIPVSLYSVTLFNGPHGDKTKLPRGCASCHKGHGEFNTPMLPANIDDFCFRCHGSREVVERVKAQRYLASDARPVNMQTEFEKPFRHPVDQNSSFIRNRAFPEIDSSLPRSVGCTDCHHHHYVTSENKFNRVKGLNNRGVQINSIIYEYELCFKCHSKSANLPAYQTDKAEIFDVSNPSYHPVVTEGKNSDVPSLRYPLTTSSLIKCTDCHNNNDSTGPKGPHGSIYEYLLTKNFSNSDGAEGPFQYELCYSCHLRSSILGDESFSLHNLHISIVGTSCRTCHNPHGSTRYPHLIEFDSLSIDPSSNGSIDFRDLGIRAGECYLSCHGKNHNPAMYPITSLSSSR